MRLTENMVFPQADPNVLLNKRTELILNCHHRNKFILNSVEQNPSKLTW